MTNYARAGLMALTAILTLLLVGAIAYGQRPRAAATTLSAPQQPLFSEYKGIRLGMTASEVRAKLGDPTVKADDQDYYVISQTESAQFAYDKALKIVTISIDYTGPGSPDYRNVVGASIDQKEDGALYKMVRYETQHFWVSYCRTGGASPTVTITIQKII
jgi:hypothetical protein